MAISIKPTYLNNRQTTGMAIIWKAGIHPKGDRINSNVQDT